MLKTPLPPSPFGIRDMGKFKKKKLLSIDKYEVKIDGKEWKRRKPALLEHLRTRLCWPVLFTLVI
jgi:hypothetical protein